MEYAISHLNGDYKAGEGGAISDLEMMSGVGFLGRRKQVEKKKKKKLIYYMCICRVTERASMHTYIM
jgi:hypothetical protein